MRTDSIWLFTLLTITFTLNCTPSSASVSKAIITLVHKYSNNLDFLNVNQLQQFLDNIYGSRSNNVFDITHEAQKTCGEPDEQKCLRAEDFFEQLQVNEGKFDGTSLEMVCPIILEQVNSGICGDECTMQKAVEFKQKSSTFEVWCFGLLFVTIIVICSMFGGVMAPFTHKKYFNVILKVMMGLAVGSLTSSSIFHLIPQAFSLTDKNDNFQYLSRSVMIWIGIWTFYILERLMKIVGDYNQRHSTNSEQEQEQLGHFEQQRNKVIATVAWMIIIGDGVHNFIDGISIGAAFRTSKMSGISISIAVICEELPHELGDLAVLMSAGMALKRALKFNFLSACTCYLGLCVGVKLGEIEISHYIFGFAGGMFLYIALVDMIPEMSKDSDEASKVGVVKGIQTLILQNIGIFIGVSILYILAFYQDGFM